MEGVAKNAARNKAAAARITSRKEEHGRSSGRCARRGAFRGMRSRGGHIATASVWVLIRPPKRSLNIMAEGETNCHGGPL